MSKKVEGELHFSLVCVCGEPIEGFFGDLDVHERIYCDCGLVWDILRPHKKEIDDE